MVNVLTFLTFVQALNLCCEIFSNRNHVHPTKPGGRLRVTGADAFDVTHHQSDNSRTSLEGRFDVTAIKTKFRIYGMPLKFGSESPLYLSRLSRCGRKLLLRMQIQIETDVVLESRQATGVVPPK